jgi:hypothetical protein
MMHFIGPGGAAKRSGKGGGRRRVDVIHGFDFTNGRRWDGNSFRFRRARGEALGFTMHKRHTVARGASAGKRQRVGQMRRGKMTIDWAILDQLG